MGGEGARLDWVWLSCDQMATASERASEGARWELGLESHSSTAIPIVNWKRNPSQLCYCLLLCMIFPAPSGPVESARIAPSLKVKLPRVQKSSEQEKKESRRRSQRTCVRRTIHSLPGQNRHFWEGGSKEKKIGKHSTQNHSKAVHTAQLKWNQHVLLYILCTYSKEPLVNTMDYCRILHM